MAGSPPLFLLSLRDRRALSLPRHRRAHSETTQAERPHLNRAWERGRPARMRAGALRTREPCPGSFAFHAGGTPALPGAIPPGARGRTSHCSQPNLEQDRLLFRSSRARQGCDSMPARKDRLMKLPLRTVLVTTSICCAAATIFAAQNASERKPAASLEELARQ